MGPGPITREASWFGAVLSCGRGAALSHETAGELLDLLPRADLPRAAHVTTRRGTPRRRRGIVTHTTLVVHAVPIRGIPYTTPSRTIVDLAGRLSVVAIEDMVARAARRELLDAAALLAILGDGGRHRGARSLRQILAERDPRSGPTRSRFERAVLRLCCRQDLPRPLVNVRLDVGLSVALEVDFLWPDARVVVEADSFAFHAVRPA